MRFITIEAVKRQQRRAMAVIFITVISISALVAVLV